MTQDIIVLVVVVEVHVLLDISAPQDRLINMEELLLQAALALDLALIYALLGTNVRVIHKLYALLDHIHLLVRYYAAHAVVDMYAPPDQLINTGELLQAALDLLHHNVWLDTIALLEQWINMEEHRQAALDL